MQIYVTWPAEPATPTQPQAPCPVDVLNLYSSVTLAPPAPTTIGQDAASCWKPAMI